LVSGLLDVLDEAQAHIADFEVQGFGGRAEKALCSVCEGDIEFA
jgi:hypothetical protein